MKLLLLFILVTSLTNSQCQWSGDGSGGWNDDEDEGSAGDDDDDSFSGDDYDGDDEDLESAGLGKDVVELTDENFEKKVQQPWAEAATRLNGKMNLGALDVTRHNRTAGEFEIEV